MKSTHDDAITLIARAVETVDDRDTVVELCTFGLEKHVTKAMLSEYGGNLNSKLSDALYSFCEKKPDRATILSLMKALESIKTVRMTIVFDPSPQVITEWHIAFQTMFRVPVALAITHDQSIAGGAVIEVDGRIYRYTLASEMEKLS